MKTYLTISSNDEARARFLGAVQDPLSGRFVTPAGADLTLFQAWLPASAATGELALAPKRTSLTARLSRVGAAVLQALSVRNNQRMPAISNRRHFSRFTCSSIYAWTCQ